MRQPRSRTRDFRSAQHGRFYRSIALFKREQTVVLERIAPDRVPILDIGCGTGLMLQPLIQQSVPVVGQSPCALIGSFPRCRVCTQYGE